MLAPEGNIRSDFCLRVLVFRGCFSQKNHVPEATNSLCYRRGAVWVPGCSLHLLPMGLEVGRLRAQAWSETGLLFLSLPPRVPWCLLFFPGSIFGTR